MKHLKAIILFSIVTFLFYSCSKVSKLKPSLNKSEMSEFAKIKDRLGILNATDTILPLDSTKFLERPNIVTPQGIDLDESLQQLQGIDFYIRSTDSYFGKNTLKTNGKGHAVTLSAPSPASDAQLFHLVILPATSGIPYLIYSSKEGTPMGGGSTASAPNDYLPYIKPNNTGSLFGFSWDFTLNNDSTAFYIENQDMIYSTGPWSIGYYVMNVSSSGDLSLQEKNSTIGQQFNLVPNDVFTINSLDLDLSEGTITSSVPTTIQSGNSNNNGSNPLPFTINITNTKTDNYSFKETNGISATISIGVQVGINIGIAKTNDEFKISATTTHNVEYGNAETYTTTFTQTYNYTVPPHKTDHWSYTAMQHHVKVPFTAYCQGINTGKLFTIHGYYTGVAYSTYEFTITEYDLLMAGESIQGKTPLRTFKVQPVSK